MGLLSTSTQKERAATSLPPDREPGTRCTATLGPGSDKLNIGRNCSWPKGLLSLGLLLLSLSAVVPLACSAGRVGEGGGGGGGSTGPGSQAGGRAWAGFLCWGFAGGRLGMPLWPTHPKTALLCFSFDQNMARAPHVAPVLVLGPPRPEGKFWDPRAPDPRPPDHLPSKVSPKHWPCFEGLNPKAPEARAGLEARS
jgi:hypothetical protein